MPTKGSKPKLKNKHVPVGSRDEQESVQDGASQTTSTTLPVTLLSGFLGSGKTSLLKKILTNRSNSLRCAVIVNEISDINIDAYSMGGTGVMQVSDKMVEMSNGCICCSLREDLLLQLRELAESNKYDAVLIESSGISEPMQVSETFFVELDDGKGPLQKQARLDNCVTVVDASALRLHLQTDDDMKVVDPHADGQEATQHISALLLDQLEFANVILLNKVDNVLPGASKEKREDEIQILIGIIRSINRSAKIIPTVHCNVDVKEILDTNHFSEDFANGKNHWMEDIKSGVKHVPETLEYGVSSLVYKESRAFHPHRFHDWILRYFILEELYLEGGDETLDDDDHDDPTMCSDETHIHAYHKALKKKKNSSKERRTTEEALVPEPTAEELRDRAKTRRLARIERYGDLYRSKGFVFLGNPRRLSFYGIVSHSGNTFTFGQGSQWDDFPVAASYETCEQEAGQQLVFIGQNLKHEQLRADLDACLLTGEEEKQLIAKVMEDAWGPNVFPDPLPEFEIPGEDDDGEEEDEWEDASEDEKVEA